jgi:1,4-dihydroxy-2-naphthoate octaprenyltransferase
VDRRRPTAHLPNAVAPVIAGTGAAAWLGSAVWWKALLALTVALALIVGVNYANDYSDGVRGTDDDRVGPLRLVGSGWPRRARSWPRPSSPCWWPPSPGWRSPGSPIRG